MVIDNTTAPLAMTSLAAAKTAAVAQSLRAPQRIRFSRYDMTKSTGASTSCVAFLYFVVLQPSNCTMVLETTGSHYSSS